MEFNFLFLTLIIEEIPLDFWSRFLRHRSSSWTSNYWSGWFWGQKFQIKYVAFVFQTQGIIFWERDCMKIQRIICSENSSNMHGKRNDLFITHRVFGLSKRLNKLWHEIRSTRMSDIVTGSRMPKLIRFNTKYVLVFEKIELFVRKIFKWLITVAISFRCK